MRQPQFTPSRFSTLKTRKQMKLFHFTICVGCSSCSFKFFAPFPDNLFFFFMMVSFQNIVSDMNNLLKFPLTIKCFGRKFGKGQMDLIQKEVGKPFLVTTAGLYIKGRKSRESYQGNKPVQSFLCLQVISESCNLSDPIFAGTLQG